MKDEDTLKKMIRLYQKGMSLKALGEEFGMTAPGIRYRLAAAGVVLSRRPKFDRIDKIRLEELYLKEKFSIDAIAAHYSVERTLIIRALKFHKIPKRIKVQKSGDIIDFLRGMAVDEKGVFEWRSNHGFKRLHDSAKYIGIRISVKMLGKLEFEITRLL